MKLYAQLWQLRENASRVTKWHLHLKSGSFMDLSLSVDRLYELCIITDRLSIVSRGLFCH